MPPESPAVMRTVWHAALVEAAGGAEERAGVRTRGITRLARVCQVAARTGDKRPERSRGYGGELFYMCICENINPRDFFARGRPVPGAVPVAGLAPSRDPDPRVTRLSLSS